MAASPAAATPTGELPAGAHAASFALPAQITVADAAALLGRLADVIRGLPAGSDLRVQGAALTRFDSSALAVLLQARRQAQARGCAVQLQGLPERLLELARLYGVAELFQA